MAYNEIIVMNHHNVFLYSIRKITCIIMVMIYIYNAIQNNEFEYGKIQHLLIN